MVDILCVKHKGLLKAETTWEGIVVECCEECLEEAKAALSEACEKCTEYSKGYDAGRKHGGAKNVNT